MTDERKALHDFLEPGIPVDFGKEAVVQISQAISLKRIADALDAMGRQTGAVADAGSGDMWVQYGPDSPTHTVGKDARRLPLPLELGDLVMIHTAVGDSAQPVPAEVVDWSITGNPGQVLGYMVVPGKR